MDILLVTAQEGKHEPSCSLESGSSMYCRPLPFLKLLRWLILHRIANEQDGVKGPIHSAGQPTSPAEGKEKNQYDSELLIKLQPLHLNKKKA